MKKILFLVFCLILSLTAWADAPAPPVPMPSGDNADLMPPADINQLTPVTIPPAMQNEVNKKAAVSTSAPTATPISKKEVKPTSTPTAEPSEETTTEKSSGTTVSLGALTDYFPLTEGAQWAYEYMKPASGETAKGTYKVKCLSAKTMPNGSVQAVLETNAGGQQTRDRYSLYGNMVEHTATGETTLTGDFVFKLPGKGAGTSWTTTQKDGTTLKAKAVFGKAQVFQKSYPDSIIVTEKTVKDGKINNTLIYYYAKGIGLVSIEAYSSKMKLVQDKSVALVSGPGAN